MDRSSGVGALAPEAQRARDARLARLALIGAAVLFSTGGAAVKSSALTPIQVAGGRSLVAALFVLLLVPGARRWPRAEAAASGAGRLGALVSVAFGLTMLLFVLASRWTTAANAVLLQATAPLFVLLLGPALLGERIRRTDLLTLAAMGLGAALFFTSGPGSQPTAPRPMLGNVLGAVTGLTWALVILGMRWLGGERPEDRSGTADAAERSRRATLACVSFGNLLVAGVALPFVFPLPALELRELLLLLWLGGFQIGVAYLLVGYGLRRVPAFEASLLFLVEPVLNPLWAFLVHGEASGPGAVAGGALILLGAAHSAWSGRGKR